MPLSRDRRVVAYMAWTRRRFGVPECDLDRTCGPVPSGRNKIPVHRSQASYDVLALAMNLGIKTSWQAEGTVMSRSSLGGKRSRAGRRTGRSGVAVLVDGESQSSGIISFIGAEFRY